jgi:hypothetical protein
MTPLSLLLLSGLRAGRRSTLLPCHSSTLGTSPPSLRHESASAWQRLMCWLLAPPPDHAAHPINRVPGVRQEFAEALADVAGDDADALRNKITLARSLRDLWHLRTDVYRVVGVVRSQGVAQERLARLNRHFPARAPRSQFGAL